MTDEKNQGGGSGDTAAERLAQQRKALNLQTQPLEVIADLDWDVDDDDAEFTLPTPIAASTPAETKSEPKRTSSGTMAMSASDFAAAMRNEPAGEELSQETDDAIEAPSEQTATTARNEIADSAPHLAKEATHAAASTSSGGTMLLSGDAMKEAMEAAKLEAETTGAEHRETAPHTAVASETTAEPQRSAGGTMLMSSDAIQQEIEKQAPQQDTTPSTTANTGSLEEVSTPAHEPQTPAWNEEESHRPAAEWSTPSADEASATQSASLLSNLSPNLRLVLALSGVILAVVILWLIFR